eukprot:6207523-Lingulodinium_polyedra.AAC.1
MRPRGSAAHCRSSARTVRAVAASGSSPKAWPIAALKWGRADAAFSHTACTSRSGRSCEAALAMAGIA